MADTVWIIEPRDPLISRDGRPSGVGGRLTTTPFPASSMTAGAVRTRLGWGESGFRWARGAAELYELKDVAVHGPLLVELDGLGKLSALFVPPPADAVCYRIDELSFRVVSLSPDQGGDCDLQDSAPLRSRESRKEKAVAGPAFWSWKTFSSWLEAPTCADRTADELGLKSLDEETRTHVAVSESGTAEDGMIFESTGLRFWGKRRLALSVRVGDFAKGKLTDTLAPLGGERRLAFWRSSGVGWPAPSPRLREAVVKTGRARVILLTPGVFKQGWRPSWEGVKAAAVGRPTVTSGWDLENGTPKPTRRLAPAGSVYFLTLPGGEAERAAWFDRTWLRPVSEDEQACRDGFGLAAVGSWAEAA